MLFFPHSRVQILKTEHKYGQYCTPLSESDCRYFCVLAINTYIHIRIRLDDTKTARYCSFINSKAKKLKTN